MPNLRKSLEDFIGRAKELHGNQYNYDKVVLVSMSEKIIVTCPDHGDFLVVPSQHVNKRDKIGCKSCGKKTQGCKKPVEKVLERFKEVHGNKYDYSLMNYQGMHIDILIKCNCCGLEFNQRPDAHIYQKQGCPVCGLANRRSPLKKNTEQFLKEFKESHGDKYDTSETVYTNKNTKIMYCCPVEDKYGIAHGPIEQLPPAAIKNGCYYCSERGVPKHTFESFTKKANSINNREDIFYTYEKVKFDKITDEVEIYCTTCCSYFLQKAHHHLREHGCPNCNGGVKLTQEKYEQKCKEKFGPHNFLCEKTIYTKAHDKITFNCQKHGEFKQLAYSHFQTTYPCPGCYAEITSSIAEQEVADFVAQNYTGKMIRNDRKIIAPKEIDILLPDLKFGIEYCGLYWHRTGKLNEKYLHRMKCDMAVDQDIKLIQIFENQWEQKRPIIESRILSSLGKGERIYAKKTEVCELSLEKKNQFLDRTHLKGRDSNSSVRLGLKYNTEIVACMTFGSPRFRGSVSQGESKKYTWEIIRYSSELNKNVIGGASKLFAHFLKKTTGNVVSYADRLWSPGQNTLYASLGFKFDGYSNNGYFFYNSDTKEVLSRYQCFKNKLIDRMPIYDEDLSGEDIMKLNGFDTVFDAGNSKWIFERN